MVILFNDGGLVGVCVCGCGEGIKGVRVDRVDIG